MAVETVTQRASILARRGSLCKHDHVHRGRGRAMAECLSRNSFEAIAIDRTPSNFSRNGETETSVAHVVGARKYGEESIGRSFGPGHDA
jgi:hypothetical protein